MPTIVELSRRQQRLERQHRQLLKSLENGPLAWIVPRFLSATALGMGLTLVLPGFLGGGLGIIDPSSRAFWIRVLGPMVAAGVGTLHLYFHARRQSRSSLEEVVRRSDEALAQLTGPGWVRRVLRDGSLLTLGVGLPIGVLLAFTSPVTELPGGSRLLAIAGFVAVTAAWAMPGAFGIRWMWLKWNADRPASLEGD